jgi:hypothetical protein
MDEKGGSTGEREINRRRRYKMGELAIMGRYC